MFTTITNINEQPVKIEINESFTVESLNLIDINIIEKMETEDDIESNYDNLLKQNMRNLLLNHCIKDETDAIRRLCFDYGDIFYCGKTLLSFCNGLQHKIN